MIRLSRGLHPAIEFLFHLAWASRVRLPLLIATAFMITNVHMRLEINVNFEMTERNENAINDEEESDEEVEIIIDNDDFVEEELREYPEETTANIVSIPNTSSCSGLSEEPQLNVTSVNDTYSFNKKR